MLDSPTCPDRSCSRTAEASRLRDLLRGRVDRRVAELHLVVTDGGLVLSGRAYSWFGKQLAQQAAMELTGLPVARNEITVCPPNFASDDPDSAS